MSPRKRRGPGEKKKPSGFGTLSPERRREIAREGGLAAHAKGVAHEFTSEEAALAGEKGGRSVSRDREHMAKIGRTGGRARKKRQQDEEGDDDTS